MSSTQFEPVGWAVTARFRRAGQVVCYWADSGLVLHNYASGVRITAAPLAMQLLDFFGAWHTPPELIAAFATYDAASLCAAMADLFEASLLECEALDPGGVRDDEGWAAWNPAAGFFHDATKNVRYRDVHGRSADELVGQDWRPRPTRMRHRSRYRQRRPPARFPRFCWRDGRGDDSRRARRSRSATSRHC